MEARSRGHRIAFTRAGEGPPVVLVPGIMMSAQRWVDTGYVSQLAEVATVIAIDPLGHGGSSRPDDPSQYRFPEVADDLVAVLDDLGIVTAAWWGYSRGGQLACSVAMEHPERVSKLVVGGFSPSVGPELLDATSKEWAPLLRDGGWPAFWPKFPVPEPIQRMFEQTNDPTVIAAVMEGAVGMRLDVNRIRCPSLVYAGGEDIWARALDDDARTLSASTHQFDGLDHAGTFAASAVVLPVILHYLGLPAEG